MAMAEEVQVDREQFADWVHDALGKLYDSLALQAHPLAGLFDAGRAQAAQRGQTLRKTLLAALQSLRPGSGVPAGSPDWRAYRLLELRYLEGLDPQEAMGRLGLAKTQYYREQSRVLQRVTDVLWNSYQEARAAAAPGPARADLIRAEVERLTAHSARAGIDDAELLADLDAIVRPLAQARGVAARLVSMRALRGLPVDRVLLRQALLAAVNVGLNLPGARHLEVDSPEDPVRRAVRRAVRVRAWPPAAESLPAAEAELCRSLLNSIQGALEVERTEQSWELRLTWPQSATRALLVIDDNAGLVELFRRYLAGHPWRVLGASDGLEARQVIAETPPDVIILDVMMPKEDGWEFLMALKTGEAGPRATPIIMCSVLNQPQIAAALGAAGHLPKPVTQQALLEALAPWSA
jgi:CheY-like chemotaxis protein